jgi:hypothetical protein
MRVADGRRSVIGTLEHFLPLLGWFAVSAFLWSRLDRIWNPHDEGVWAHPAERVLRGELPFKDFNTGYSGGADVLNALAMRLFGVNLLSPRLMLFLFFLLFLGALYYVARGFLPRGPAAAVMVLGGVSSVPQHPPVMPSWYNLFFAVFALAFIVRYERGSSAGWLLVSGLCAGLSVWVKITGLYLVGGVLLGMGLWVSAEAPSEGNERDLAWVGTLVPAVALIWMQWQVAVRDNPATEIFHFLLPTAALCVSIAVVTRRRSVPILALARSWLRLATPFMLGFLAVITAWGGYYWSEGALPELIEGVLVRPSRFVDMSYVPPPGIEHTLLGLLGSVPLVLVHLRNGRLGARWAWVAVACGALLVCFALGGLKAMANATFSTTRPWVVVACLWAAIRTCERFPGRGARMERRMVGMLASVLALTSLIQVPQALDVYVFFTAPILILTVAALAVPQRLFGFPAFTAAYVLYLGWLVANSQNLIADFTTRLPMERGHLRVGPEDAAVYGAVVNFVQENSAGRYILAVPDAPQIYFLSGRENPTRSMLDHLEDPAERLAEVREALRAGLPDLVVFQNKSSLAPGLDPQMKVLLEEAFPEAREIGHFTVRTRSR